MERKVIFRDYQEQQGQDHNDIQSFARSSLDHLVLDAVTATRRYAGFTTQKTAQTEIQVSPGRFYDVDGGVYVRASTLVQSMISYLPAAARRYVLVSVSGVENETDVETRDFLVDVETRRTEPRAVATTSARDAIINLTSGSESADPQIPAVPATHAAVAAVLLDPTGVLSVSMMSTYEVVSTEELDVRAILLEAFKSAIEPRVASLASDLAALAARIGSGTGSAVVSLTRIYKDLARLKEKADLPQDAADYGSDNFLSTEHSDTDDSGGLGYDAKISNGLGFATANADEDELSLFSANDPNASNTNGLVLPKYTSVPKLKTGDYSSEVSISQYGYQTFDMVQKTIHHSRLRYGPWWGYWWPYPEWYYYPYGLFPYLAWTAYYPWILDYYPFWPYYYYRFYPYYWWETWDETYWELETTNHSIDGAQVAQTFLNANDMWATQIGFYVTAKGAEENIFVTLCETTNGQPDLSKVISHTIYDEDDIAVGWNYCDIVPTFLKSGGRYAVVLTSAANHKLGMTNGNNYLDGTFFYSTDSVYYLGDLTKDLMIAVNGARFNNPQVTIEMAPINLDGGIRAIDLLAGTVTPASTQLVFEVRPSGVSDWIPLDQDHLTALASAPPLFQFRARFVGTRDVAPALMLTGSRMNVSRPKTTFKHVSEVWTIENPSSDITVVLTMAGFDDTPHDCTCRLYYAAGYHDPAATSDEVIDAVNKVVRRTFHFTPSSISTFTTVIDGTTTSPANLFTVTEMLFWAL